MNEIPETAAGFRRIARSPGRRVLRAALACLLPVVCAGFVGRAAAQEHSELPSSGAIAGQAKDPSGALIVGAVVTLQPTGSAGERMTITDAAGAFRFSPVRPGSYQVTITASGFAAWTADHVKVASGANPTVISAVLRVAAASTRVTVTLPPRELAVKQVKAEEKQRLIGVFPNYFVTYEPNAAPLNAKQKFQLAWKTVFDPVPILFSGIGAGIQQARNSYAGYGQGVEGFAKRFGANYADRVDGTLIGGVLVQSVLHQDPRYFYKGKGSIGSRVLYAIATAFVAKGDNGHWQPAYADVLGGMASYGVSTLYRPGTSRPGLRLFHTVLLGFAGRASDNLFQEFVLRKLTTHVPKLASESQPILRAGTPLTLISAGDLSTKTTGNTGPVEFVLARDIRVDGTVVAKAGTPAWGRVHYTSLPGSSGGTHVALADVRLRAGKVEVPLRNTQVRHGGGALEYHRLENSGRIAVVLYVDKDVALPPAQ